MGWKDTIEKDDAVTSGWKQTIEDGPPPGEIETFAKTVADELTLGYYPQIAAGVKTLGGTDGNYAEQRDAELKDIQRGQMENKVASGLGTAAAIAGQMAIPAGGAVKVAQMAKAGLPIAKQVAKEIAKNFAMGSAISGLKNPGDVPGEVTPIQATERMENVTSEIPLNLGAAAVGGLIDARAAKKAAAAPEEIVKILRPTPTKASILIKDDAKRANEVGEFIFNRKIVTPGANPQAIVKRAEQELEKSGRNLGNFIKTNAAKFDANKTVDNILQNPTFAPERDLPELYSFLEESLIKKGVSGAQDVASNVVEQVIQDYNTLQRSAKRAGTKAEQFALNLEGLTQMKRFMQDQVSNYDSVLDKTKDAGKMSEGFDRAANFFRKKIDDEIAKFGDDELGKQLKRLNKDYSLASDAYGLTNRNAVRAFLKQDSSAPLTAGLGSSALTFAMTKDPYLASMVGMGAGAATKAAQSIAPTTKAAIQYQVPEMLSRNIIPKASGYYAAQESTPVLPQSNLEKARLLNEQRKQQKGR